LSDPLALLPLAIAAGGGSVDAFEAQQLVAAGLTLLQRSAQLVRALAGRRAAILLPTSPQFLVALAACEGRGAVLVNPLAAPAEVAFQLENAHVGAVFTNAALAARTPEHVVRVLLDDAPRTARVLANGASRDVDLGSHFALAIEGETDVPGRDEEAAIVYTSAMAGTPRGAVLLHRNLVANARSCISAMGLVAEDRVLALLPFTHLFGLTVTASAPLLTGASVTTMARFNPRRAIAAIVERGITVLVGVPTVYHTLLAAMQKGDVDARRVGSSLRVCICGGAELPVDLQDRWFDATAVELRQGYGLTEGAPVCLFNGVDHDNARGTLGTPFPNVEVSIRAPITFDDDGHPRGGTPDESLPPETVGEICVRGDNVFAGYVDAAESGLVTSGGWLHTGDLGVQRDDGAFVFRGVVKPMFTRSGFNVYPREIERVVRAMPGVRRAHARAIPEPLRENDIALAIVGNVSETDVKRWCGERLAAYKQPSRIEITDA
jgi:long-chain acyl-CoA synthetase